jgi:hypothetical protein
MGISKIRAIWFQFFPALFMKLVAFTILKLAPWAPHD